MTHTFSRGCGSFSDPHLIMQLANVELWLNAHHWIQLRRVTPAEAFLLQKIHSTNNGRLASVLVHDDEIERSSAEELARLLRKYKPEFVNKGDNALWPGATPTLPQKFSEVTLECTIGRYVAPPLAPPITSFPMGEDAETPEPINL